MQWEPGAWYDQVGRGQQGGTCIWFDTHTHTCAHMYARGVCNKAVKDAIYSRIITAIQSVALTLTLILVPIQTFIPPKIRLPRAP